MTYSTQTSIPFNPSILPCPLRRYLPTDAIRTIPPGPPTLQVSSLQLLHHQAPQAALLILVVSPFFDDTGDILAMIGRAFFSGAPSSHWLRTAQDEGAEVAATAAAGVNGSAAEGEAAGGAGSVFWAGVALLSCLLAFLVNLSTFLVIGKTSPVSYQVLMGRYRK